MLVEVLHDGCLGDGRALVSLQFGLVGSVHILVRLPSVSSALEVVDLVGHVVEVDSGDDFFAILKLF